MKLANLIEKASDNKEIGITYRENADSKGHKVGGYKHWFIEQEAHLEKEVDNWEDNNYGLFITMTLN